MAIPVKKMLSALHHPKRIFGYYYRGVDFWPPQNFRRHYRIKFYLIELPVRWMFKGVFPQKWDGGKFRTFFDEDLFIDKFFQDQSYSPQTFVDIGAGDGIDMNNTFKLAHRGLSGVSIEGSPIRFAQLSLTYERFTKVELVRTYVSSHTISNLLKGFDQIPNNFDVLNLDIDSFDYHILKALLQDFKPKLCVIEWNRSYPPSVFFSVSNDPTIRWDSTSGLFQGASLRAFHELLGNVNYKIIEVQGSALFAIPENSGTEWEGLSVDQAWSRYLGGPKKWVETDLNLLKLSHEELVSHFAQELSKYNTQYEIR